MAYTHEFGIIDCIEENKAYTYEPKKYNCITINENKWLIHYGL